jgi:hypothetical protein
MKRHHPLPMEGGFCFIAEPTGDSAGLMPRYKGADIFWR